MRRLLCLGIALWTAACAPPAVTIAPSAAATAGSSPPVTAVPGVGFASDAGQEARIGPAGMTLRQEIGAVLMVGFRGPLTPAILADWRRHQFGGLLVVPINQNAADPAAIRQLIQSVRGVMTHPVLTATDQEGGTVCFRATRVPCLAGARQAGAQGFAAVQSEMTSMSQGLQALGFDINLAPVADVWDGVHPFMSERSYGQDPQTVAQDVTAAIAGMHAAGIYAAARTFPGYGSADADPQFALPLVSESARTLRTRDWIPFQAAIAAHVDFVVIGHLTVPALDATAPASMSASVVHTLRTELGYPGIIVADDLQLGALSPAFPPPAAAVRFLANGGDMVIVSHDIGVADATYDAIHTAVLDGAYPRTQLDASVQKLLSLGLRYMP